MVKRSRRHGSSQCTSPKHPVSCIEPRLAIRFLYDIIHFSMPFSQIIPPSPSLRVQKTELVLLKSLSFHISVKFLISPSNLNERFLDGFCSFFFLITLSILCHSLLACSVSAEKSLDNFMGIPLHVISCLSLITFNIFSLIFCQFEYYVS